MTTTAIVIFVILIILFLCGAFDRIIYPNDFKEEEETNQFNSNYKININKKKTYQSDSYSTITYNEVYVCEVKHNLYSALIFYKNGYVGFVDAIETKITEDMKEKIKDFFHKSSLNPLENINQDFGKYEISNGTIKVYLAPKYDYLNGIESLPYSFFGFEGKIKHNYLILDMTKKWFNQSLKKSEISTLTTNLLFKT